MARLRLWLSGVRIPVAASDFLFSRKVQICSRAHPTPFSMSTGAPSLGVNWPGHNVYHSTLSNAEVMNEWIYTSTPPICLHAMNGEAYLYLYSHICDWLIFKNISFTITSVYFNFSLLKKQKCV